MSPGRDAVRRRDAEKRGRIAAERRGRIAERLALLLLVAKGYRILERRYKTPVGEVDIIARRGSALVFLEVKARERMDDAAASIGLKQRQRIADAAAAYLARNPDIAGLSCRFDAILVARGRLPKHVIDAWQTG